MKVSFYTLGCKVNQYETQSMREQFRNAGYEIADDEEQADICVINTCSVTNIADRKSRQYIRRMKHLNPEALIVVTGCYAQTDPEAVTAVEGVHIVAGTNEKSKILEYVSEYIDKRKGRPFREQEDSRKAESHVRGYEELNTYEDMGTITAMESRSRAFVKIEEGCDRFCSYCIIPYARGKVRSRSIGSVTSELESLIRSGYHEVVLTGINTALYGRDRTGREHGEGLLELLDVVTSLEGDFRIRLSSLEPNVISTDTAQKLIRYNKLCGHMHLSVQSGSDSVLKRMNRRYTVADYREIAGALRSDDPDYGLTTDIIVGFPGETEREFEETLHTVRSLQFSGIHVFKYSPRKNTAAAKMPDQIDGTVKNRRAKILEEEAGKQKMAFYQRNTGKVRQVLFERITEDGKYLEGYSDNYIQTYVPVSGNNVEYLHGFAEVRLVDLYLDGMEGIIIKNDR